MYEFLKFLVYNILKIFIFNKYQIKNTYNTTTILIIYNVMIDFFLHKSNNVVEVMFNISNVSKEIV